MLVQTEIEPEAQPVPVSPAVYEPAGHPTVWGLRPAELHDYFWAARGVHVVRQGEPSVVVKDAELYLLIDPRAMVIFRLRPLVETLSWTKPEVLFLRLRNARERRYREMIVTDEEGQFLRTVRYYDGFESRFARVALTRARRVAELWQNAPDPRTGWRMIRRDVDRRWRETASVTGWAYDRQVEQEVAAFSRDLVQYWKTPVATVADVKRLGMGVWAHEGVSLHADTRVVGAVWIGAGRTLPPDSSVLGPAILWDDPASRPERKELRWEEIEPSVAARGTGGRRKSSSLYQSVKRGFDVLFSITALLLTAPVYPIVMLAIWLEDGRPFFFAHRRETLGGKQFPCIKFRSMRKDAERIKAQLVGQNQADGPQFFIQNDPRLTRVGRIIRRLNIDELPQFLNVLVGHMSVVGPRPSPRKENQYCPPWREARLSVRPGITGLWQVKRTRRQGEDFQEWIKYDLEYVEKASLKLDLYVIVKTIWMMARGKA